MNVGFCNNDAGALYPLYGNASAFASDAMAATPSLVKILHSLSKKIQVGMYVAYFRL